MVFKTALIQFECSNDFFENISRILKFIDKASKNNAKIICLPEMFCCPYKFECFENLSISDIEYLKFELSKCANKNNIYLIAGSIPEKVENKIYNTCFIYDFNGNEIGKYRKLHLFDVSLNNKLSFHESQMISKGDSALVIDTIYGKIGIEICFDIRFPELTDSLTLCGAEMIFCPANFAVETGKLHWELLLRSRAVDSQCYVFGCGTASNKKQNFISYGHSMAVDPFGKILSKLDDKEGILYVEIDLEYEKQLRRDFPILKLKRKDIMLKNK